MSWDGILMRLPEDARHMDEVPEDYDFPPVGAPEAVHAALSKALPGSEHTIGKTIFQDGTDYLQLSYTEYEDVDCIDVYSLGGVGAARALQVICDMLGVTVVDNRTNDIADIRELMRA